MPARRKRTIDPEAKREAILAAAEAMFAERGYSATSTAAIAASAGVASGTVFRHFADKATLLAALHERLERRFADAMTAAWEGAADRPALERFEPMFEALFDVAAAQRRLMPVLRLAVASPASGLAPPGTLIRARIEAQCAEAMARGEFRTLPPAVVAGIAHGMVDGALGHWLANPTPRRRREAIATLVAMCRAALAP